MQQSLAWDFYKDRAHAEILAHQKRILTGRLTEEQYRREAGWVDGAMAILGLPTQMTNEFTRARATYDEARAADAEAEEAQL